MGLFISEGEFIEYMGTQKAKSDEVNGISLISLNIRSLQPITTVVFISHNFLFAAKYNEKLGFYSDGFFIEKKDIERYHLTEGILQNRLVIETKIPINEQKNMQLKMSFSKATAVAWHKYNLKRLKKYIS